MPSAPGPGAIRSSGDGGAIRGSRSTWTRCPDGAEESLPQVFPGRLQPGRPAVALLSVRNKVTGPLPGRVQLGDGLVEVDAYLADQQRGAVQA